MKKLLILLSCLLLVGCGSKPSTTETSDTILTPAETTEKNYIDAGTEGSRDFELDIYNVDGSITIYKGKTDTDTFQWLVNDVSRNTALTYEISGRERSDYDRYISFNGQTVEDTEDSYFAIYADGQLLLDINQPLPSNTSLYEVKYCTTNVLSAQNILRIPSEDDVTDITIIDNRGELQSSYVFDRQQNKVFFGYDDNVQTKKFSEAKWNSLRTIVLSVDYDVPFISAPTDAKFIVYINGREYQTNDLEGILDNYLKTNI